MYSNTEIQPPHNQTQNSTKKLANATQQGTNEVYMKTN